MKKLIMVPTITLLAACSGPHHKDVRPGNSGVHSITINTEDKSSGYRDAKAQADHFCAESKQTTFIVSEDHKYQGNMNEDNYNTAKTASKIIKEIGSATWVFSDHDKTRQAGEVAAVGGQVTDSALGKGYSYTMTFQCQ